MFRSLRPGRVPGAGERAVPFAERVPERTSGSATARRGVSPGIDSSRFFKRFRAAFCIVAEVLILYPFLKRPHAFFGRFFRRFSRDRGSPFAFSARRRPSCQGDSLRRVWNCSARRRQTSSSDSIVRCRNQVLSTQLSATVCTGPAGRTVLRVPWRSDKSFRFKGSGIHRFLPLEGATRFAGYGRWHSSRQSLLLGLTLL